MTDQREEKELLTWEEQQQQQERPAVERLHPAPTLLIRSAPTRQTAGRQANAGERDGNREDERGGGGRGGELWWSLLCEGSVVPRV